MVSWEKHRAEGQRGEFPVLALLLSHCMTLARVPLLSGLSLFIYEMGTEGKSEKMVSKNPFRHGVR